MPKHKKYILLLYASVVTPRGLFTLPLHILYTNKVYF